MAIIPDFYINAVVSIGVRKKEEIKWIGTGFFVVKKVSENEYQPFMVTNRHVLKEKQAVVIRLREKDTNKLRIVDMPLFENGKKLYSQHEDNNIDIAVVLLNGGFITKNNLDFAAFNIDEHALNSQELIENGVDEGAIIYMLGFPMGLVNLNTNVPICRMGCIARMDEAEIKDTKNLLLDIQNFPGNSGSPIITRPEVTSLDGTKALSKCVLLGIIHSYIPYEETLVNSQTGRTVEIRSENSGIAKANPVEFIREVVEMEYKRQYFPES